MDKQGQRFLLSMNSPTEEIDQHSDIFIFETYLVAIFGVLCLVYAVLMCACTDSGSKKDTKDLEPQKRKNESKVKVTENGAEDTDKTLPEAAAGDRASRISVASPGQIQTFNPASSHVRPSNPRVLPAPPVPNKTRVISRIESAGMAGKVNEDDHVHRQHPQQSHSSNNSKELRKDGSESESQYYDHLGLKPIVKPSDYDSFAELNIPAGPGHNIETTVVDDDGYDYCEVQGSVSPVLIEVRAEKRELLDSLSKVTEENPYNHIGDSDGTVSVSFIQNLKTANDQENLYNNVQNDSAGDLKSVLAAKGAAHNTFTPELTHLNGTRSKSQMKRDHMEQYAVVNKVKGAKKKAKETNIEYSTTYSLRPEEPPRLYTLSDTMENSINPVSPVKQARKKNYSKVTARESLASMSERGNKTLHETMPELSENTYSMVEGWSGEDIEIGATRDDAEDSQSSDTYAEIGASEETRHPSNIIAGSGTPVSTAADAHNLIPKPYLSSSRELKNNHGLSSVDSIKRSFDHLKETLEDEDYSGSYVMLKSDAFLPSATIKESREDTLAQNNQAAMDYPEDTESYPDYECISDMPVVSVNNSLDNTLDSLGNKKFGHRRRKLDHN